MSDIAEIESSSSAAVISDSNIIIQESRRKLLVSLIFITLAAPGCTNNDLLPNKSNSIEKLVDSCIAAAVRQSVSREIVFSPSGLVSSCACIYNRVQQNLSPNDCPKAAFVSKEDLEREYEGRW